MGLENEWRRYRNGFKSDWKWTYRPSF